MRLDQFLVQNKNIESRTKAQDLIQNKNVSVNETVVIKPSFVVRDNDRVEIQNQEILKYVSRAGLKLEGALRKLSLDLNQKCILDIGQSTGGFTDCCLQFGANQIVGFDVGEQQLHHKMKSDSRVIFFEKLNVKNLSTHSLFLDAVPSGGFDVLVCDVSFISLKHVIPNVFKFLKLGGDYLFLVKPQFECGPENLDHNGVVKNKKIYSEIETKTKELFEFEAGTFIQYFESDVLGKEGNLEFFIYGRKLK